MSKANIDQKRLRDVVNASRASLAVVLAHRRRVDDAAGQLRVLRTELSAIQHSGGEDTRRERLIASRAEGLAALKRDLEPLEREHGHLSRLASAARDYAIQHGALPADLED